MRTEHAGLSQVAGRTAPLRGVLAEIPLWKKTRDGEANVIVPDYVADDLASLRHFDLPPVRTIVESPFFAAGGRLVAKPGYDPERIYYCHAASLVLPLVSEQPTPEDIDRAKSLLFDDFLADAPMVRT